MVAGQEDHARTLARLAQQFLDDVVVRLRPIPAALQAPSRRSCRRRGRWCRRRGSEGSRGTARPGCRACPGARRTRTGCGKRRAPGSSSSSLGRGRQGMPQQGTVAISSGKARPPCAPAQPQSRGLGDCTIEPWYTRPSGPVDREQQRTVEVDEAGTPGQQQRRRHGERGADHAADHQREAERFRFRDHQQGLGEGRRSCRA